jgi:hypothetical protein
LAHISRNKTHVFAMEDAKMHQLTLPCLRICNNWGTAEQICMEVLLKFVGTFQL